MEQLKIDHNRKDSKFVGLKKNGKYEEVGEIRYRAIGDQNFELYWTEVKEGMRSKGYGTELVKEVLDYVVQNKLKIKPSCSFINSVLEKHGEYGKIISGKH